MVNTMPTYSKSEFCAKSSEILKSLENGEEVVITQRGKPWAKLTLSHNSSEDRKEREPRFNSLREALIHVRGGRELTGGREATEEDFQSVKTMWRMPPPNSDDMPPDHAK